MEKPSQNSLIFFIFLKKNSTILTFYKIKKKKS
jgi:hypothetical protein